MEQFTVEQKRTTLNDLYGRIQQVVAEMGGTVSRGNAQRSFPGAMVGDSKVEDVPSLLVGIRETGLLVEFAPSNALNVGSALSVRARRTHGNVRKSDWQFRFDRGNWRRAQSPLADAEIRECLTPDGPTVPIL
jgi:hypothetical protein